MVYVIKVKEYYRSIFKIGFGVRLGFRFFFLVGGVRLNIFIKLFDVFCCFLVGWKVVGRFLKEGNWNFRIFLVNGSILKYNELGFDNIYIELAGK